MGAKFAELVRGMTLEDMNALRETLREEEDLRKKEARPKAADVKDVDWDALHRTVKRMVDRSLAENREVKDMAHYVYEATLTAMYGAKIFAVLDELDGE